MASPEPVAVLTDVNAEHECLTALSATAQQLLKFRLYDDDEGVWVCCDWCNVWRYVAEHKDPAAFLKRTFHCKEVEKKCNVGVEEGSDQVFYETKYCAGSLVWAKRPDGRKEKDWLWWPALVEDSPDSVSQYFLLDESGHNPIAYHVTFLDAFRTCDWVESDLMKPFDPETKALNKPAASRAGKKQRFLKEAMERAKMAAKYSVVDRLDNFSYIAHMARLRGMIKSSKRPADKILNGTEQVLENLPKDSPRKGTLDSEHKKQRNPRKRKLETPENDVMSKKSASSEASDIVKTRATGQTRPQSIDESAEEAPDGITAQSDSKIDADSGYAFDEESSLDKLFPTGRKRAAPEIKTTFENQSDSLNMSEFSSSLDEEKSRLSGSITNRARKQNVVKSMNSKQVPSAGTKDLKASGKNVARGSPVTPADPIELSKTKTTKRRKSLPKDSVVESLPGDYASEAAPVAAGTALESVPDIAGSATAKFIQESGSGSSDGSMGFMPTITEEVSKHVALELDSNTLEPTSNLRVTKKRRPQRQNPLTNENESSEAVSFTQPSSKERAATKKLGLTKRQNPAAQVKPSQSLSMSQPLPPRPRGKFAPPTRIKSKEGDYLLDDLHRDLDRGAF